jgi:glycosyltransferase involved in cell wall biosynthesis
MPEHDVAIYAPLAYLYYDRAAPKGGGGAERQTFLLAHSLARHGLRVAHVVYPVADPVVDPERRITLIERPRPESHGSARDLAEKLADVWKALGEADARVQVLRGANGTLGVAGAWSRLHRRRLVFAGANNSDFTHGPFSSPRDPRARLFAAGIRMTDAVVVQHGEQVELARRRFPRAGEPVQINSFVDEVAPTAEPGEAFLWVSRLVDYKRPLLYADLAAALPQARFWIVPIKTEDPEYATTLDELRRRAAAHPNLEILDQRTHAELQRLVARAVAMVNTSSYEGMPNTWLEGWARGVPALTLSFDPDGRVDANGLGVAAGGDWEAFVAGAERLWEGRANRCGMSDTVRSYVGDAHGAQVAAAWAALIERLISG